MMPPTLTTKRMNNAATRALQWLERCIAVNGGTGAAAYRHLWRGWASPYPETTGYLIETLFDYHHSRLDESLKQAAISCADWLVQLQQADGAFPGGVGVKGAPIVFDTGQILFGLTRAYAETGDSRYLQSVEKAVNWLLSRWEMDGCWKQNAYVSGYEPSYYTRVVWAVLYANQYLRAESVNQVMQTALLHYAAKITSVQSVRDWGFKPGEPAFTHTIAYTLQGFLEAARLLSDSNTLSLAKALADRLLQVRQAAGCLAGAYDENWRGNYRFVCLTGNAQCSLLFSRLFEITGEAIYREEALWLLGSVLKKQGRNGALAGSSPIWGAYLPFRYPNWSVKFLLDAITLASRH
ncbi:MAG: prenyltransferase/squalene oxidase repeat-containing protein [Saprospiraceae bacterium]|nr:prenyltransferase/squalene oxidase repeat-containing protein [Saprospiraceae bacterium]